MDWINERTLTFVCATVGTLQASYLARIYIGLLRAKGCALERTDLPRVEPGVRGLLSLAFPRVALDAQAKKWSVLAQYLFAYLPFWMLAGAPLQVYLLFWSLRPPASWGLLGLCVLLQALQAASVAAIIVWVARDKTLLLLKTYGDLVVVPSRRRAARFEWGRIARCVPEGARVLDVGAGHGLLAELIRTERSCEVRAFDPAPWALGTVPVEAFGAEALPLEDGGADVALCLCVLHHCKDPDAVLRELRRVASRLILIEDRCEGPWERLFFLVLHLALERYWKMTFEREGFLTSAGWRERLEGAGFRVVEMRALRLPFLVAAQLLIVADRRP
jgi:SAM-dependent methyltransferase